MTEHNYRDLADELGIRGRQSGDQLRAGCPVHGGRDPNFSLHVPSGQWTCHSSCGSGNFYRLVSLVLGVSLTAALDWVAEHDLGVYTAPEPTGALPVPERPRWRLAYEAATAEELPIWWFDRGFDWVDAQAYDVRWDAAAQQLLIPVLWDGALVGTIARNLKRGLKYVNSPGLPKSEILFGLRRPVPAIVWVCEGPLDQIWLTKHGYAAGALLGLTEERGEVEGRISGAQLRLLRDCHEIVLAMDNDEPGRRGQRAITDRWYQVGSTRQLRMVTYPSGRKDCGECSPDELASMAAQRTVAV